MTTGTETEQMFSPPPSAGVVQRSPWHSPLPYLFGGLAAMLGLIAFALLILACSYFKKSRDENEGDIETGVAAGEKSFPVFEEKILVIMAGDKKPTFLATPMSFSSGSRSPCSSLTGGNSQGAKLADKENEKDDVGEKQKDNMTGDDHIHRPPSAVPNQ